MRTTNMKTIYSLTLLICFVLLSCTNSTKVNLEAEKAAILALEKKQQEFHLAENAEEFVRLFSDQFININRGVISQPTKIESYERFNNYFKTVEFIKWDDVEPPVVQISDDGSMAYSIIKKEVIASYLNQEQKVIDTTHFAWTTIYKKYNGQWKIDCVTSTNK